MSGSRDKTYSLSVASVIDTMFAGGIENWEGMVWVKIKKRSACITYIILDKVECLFSCFSFYIRLRIPTHKQIVRQTGG